MLRQIVLTSLAMTTCATFTSTKVNAATFNNPPTLTVFTEDSLQKEQGQSITFKVSFNPMLGDSAAVTFSSLTFAIDDNELSYNLNSWIAPAGTQIGASTTVANLIFDVLPPKPVKDGQSDISWATLVFFADVEGIQLPFVVGTIPSLDVVPPVPEPLTIFGTFTGLGCGILFKRKSSKKKKS
jgi:hypothetical protein